MDFILVKALGAALLPPLNLLLVAVMGLLLLMFNRRTGVAMLVVSLSALFLLSMPVVATALAGLLEHRAVYRAGNLGEPQAIVILGAGSYAAAPEYRGDTVSALTLERVRWGARLHRSSGLPILVSGGSPFATRSSEAAQMKATLEQDFHTDVKWVEDKSLNTIDSARNARRQLAAAKIDRIALVTHALHMPRAKLVFERAGFHVIEAPTGFSTTRPPGILNFLPSAQGLELSRAFLYEVLGLGWYHVRLGVIEQQGPQ